MIDKTRGQRRQERERKKKTAGKVNREGGERELLGANNSDHDCKVELLCEISHARLIRI